VADGQDDDVPLPFAAPLVLMALATALDGLVFDGRPHQNFNILRAAIVVTLDFAKCMMYKTLAHPALLPSAMAFALASRMNRSLAGIYTTRRG
jgi:hypothetical protein